MNKLLINSKKWLLASLQIALALALVVTAFVPQRKAYAAASLTIEPITWNVIGLDSNKVTVGPDNFPVGVRVCNASATETADDVQMDFVWDTTDTYINLRPGSYDSPTGDPYPIFDLALAGDVSGNDCRDVYYEVTVTRDAAAYDHTARYHITADGSNTDAVSTVTPRELYVEYLISQSRNYTFTVYLGTTKVPAGGTLDLMVGNTYDITLAASTATNGYEQIESFINFKNTIFRINSVETTYTAFDVTSPDPDAGNKLYADGCSWENDPLNPNYRSCLATGKYGGEVTVKYNVTIISGGGTTESLTNLIYDFSGSSYHYNSDLGLEVRYANILPRSLPITKQFAPSNITPGGTSGMTITITNPTAETISAVNFTDTFPTTPGAMTVAAPLSYSTSGCGTPTFAPTAGAASISFSNGTLGAYGTCVIKVNVTAPTVSASTYDNTTGSLYIDTFNTGVTASDSLLVSSAVLPPLPSTCPNPVTIAYWDMNNGTGANGSPLVTTTAAGVNSALASFFSNSGGAQLIGANPGGTTPSWGATGPSGGGTAGWAETALTSNNYFQFAVDTDSYGFVYMVFDAIPYWGGDWANPDSNVFVKTSTDGVNFTNYTPTPTVPKNNVYKADNLGKIAIAASTSTGTTTFRLSADSGSKVISTFYLDNVSFLGCARPTALTAPTISKSFSPDPIAVVDGTSTLTFTITNPDASATSILTGISFNDFLPQADLFGTAEVTNGSSAVTGTGTQFLTQVKAGSLLTIPAAPVNVTGTLAVTNGSTAVTGTGTAFSTDFAAGSSIVINSTTYTVLSVTSDTALTLATPYRAATASGQTAAAYRTYTVASITDDTHLTLTGNYAGTTNPSVIIASGLTLTAAPTTTCGSPVVGTSGLGAITLTGSPLTGTLAVNNGSASVTGTGTTFLSQVGAGRIFNLPFQLTGTVAATTGSMTITGTTTSFTTQLAVGSILRINSVNYYVAAIASNTSLTISSPYSGTTGTGLTAQGFRNYTVQSVSSDTALTLSTNYSSAVNLSGYTATAGLPGGSSGNTCTVTAVVKANGAGTRFNTSGLITSKESGENTTTNGFATDTLDAVMPPVISKRFNPNPIPQGGITTLTFSITNPNPAYAMTGVAFSDDLPAGVTVASPSGASTTGCGSPTWNVSADPLVFSGGSIAAGGTCTVYVDVTAAATGSYPNTSGNVSHTINAATINGNTASDTLVVNAVNYSLALLKQVGTSASGPWYSTTAIIPATDAVYYRYILENTGEGALTNVTITDDILGTVTCSPALPASIPAPDGNDDDHIAYCVANGGTASVGTITNTAYAVGKDAASNDVTSNDDTATYMNGNFGHLPSAYTGMNLFNEGGAFSLNGTTYLGGTVTTTDDDGINTATYTPKTTDDGITWTGSWNTGSAYANVDVTCPTTPCYLYAWFDWNGDGDFNDTDESASWTINTAGVNAINFPYPASVTDAEGDLAAGTYYTRFRVYAELPDAPRPDGIAVNASGDPVVGEIEDPVIYSDGGGGTPTPVTLAYFRATRKGGSVTFNWSTAIESGNVGFNLYVENDRSLTRINPELIPSQVVDSYEAQNYTYTAQVSGSDFYIEDVSVVGETILHGPFQLGKPYGEIPGGEEQVNWGSIQSQNDGLQLGRDKDLLSELIVPASALRPASSGNGLQLTSSLNLQVNETGIYRVSYEAMRAAGLDLRNVPLRKITVTHLGEIVPVYGIGQTTFGPGGYIEFYGEALDTIYTDTNIYTIQVNRSAAPVIQVASGNATAKKYGTPALSYTETLLVNDQNAYGNYAPGADAWYDTSLMAYTTPFSQDFTFELDALVNAPAALEMIVWGATMDAPNPDHHLQVRINGTLVADESFEGLVEQTLTASLPAGVLQNGTNTLTLTLPGDTGAVYDMINLDRYSIAYQRSFQATDGRLTFTADAKSFRVTNLPDKNAVVYRMMDGVLVRLNQVKVVAEDNGSFTATFRGAEGQATYLVNTVASMRTPGLQAVRLQADLNQPAQYLVIAHPNFMDGMQPIIAARQAQGLTVSMVDVNDIYTQYSYGIFDAQAIKDYIAYAKANLGTEYVLLVGGDTYDYRNYMELGSISFIPSLYATTGPVSRFVPVDPLYADVDGDNVPDLAIGRFPVRTTAELALIVQKTLLYQTRTYGQSSIYVADKYDGMENYAFISGRMADSLPDGWTVEKINLDTMNITTARTNLKNGMNRGVALVNYTGHSSMTQWSASKVFNTSLAAALTNYDKPFVVVQWGCWNTYYVDPLNPSLVQKFLFSGTNGAAAVLGASTLTQSNSEEALGILLTPYMTTPGTTLGQALQQAKADLALTNPEMLDVILGWTLMGDPGLMITP